MIKLKSLIEGKIKTEYRWSDEYRYSIKVYDKNRKESIQWLNDAGVKAFKKKYPKAVITVLVSDDGKYLDEV